MSSGAPPPGPLNFSNGPMERVPKSEYINNQQQQPLQVVQQQQQTTPMPSVKDEEKMPLFLIKLWNIVEDPAYTNIIRWDDSGYSFHIVDPYSFCRNVLPHYFKHNNLNSLIRQLNMYGFRKVSPLDKGGLTRSESDQDHLEFSHTCFIRGRPDLMVNIKRRQSNRTVDNSAVAVQTQNNLSVVMEELRQVREKQRNMDNKMHELTKENEALWEQLDHVRQQHTRQQQVVTKLVQFLVAMVQPNLSKRVQKRGVLAIDEPPVKRARSQNPNNSANLTEILDRLQRELTDSGGFQQQQQQNYQPREDRGPIIADVTDEFGQFVPSPTTRNGAYVAVPQVASPSELPDQQMPMFSTGQVGPQPAQYTIPRPATNTVNYQRTVPAGIKQPVKTMAPPAPAMVQDNVVQPCSSNQVAQIPSNFSPSPAFTLSPALERQISQELQEYLNGVDLNIDNCRDLLSGQWDLDFLENLEDAEKQHSATNNGRLALEQAPPSYHGDDLLVAPDVGASVDVLASPNVDQFIAAGDPGTPQLLTPCTSPPYHP